MKRSEGTTRRVFVIMPFITGGTRNEAQLTACFENHIKRPIEAAELSFRYVVHRSGQTFDITAEIIRDLCRADIVIADLSGIQPNSNVMYELGVRLAISDLPVILIREQNKSNERVFDIHGFYTHEYDPYNYTALENHLVDKLRRLEGGDEPYTNSVLGIIREEMFRLNPDLTNVSPTRQGELARHGVQAIAESIKRAYGPAGLGLAVDSSNGVTLIKQGAGIARAIQSSNPFEGAGIRLMTGAAIQMAQEFGDGAKLPIIIANSLIEGCAEAMNQGILVHNLLEGIAQVMTIAESQLTSLRLDGQTYGRQVASTAANGPLEVDLFGTLLEAGPNGAIFIEEDGLGESSIEQQHHLVLDFPVMDELLPKIRTVG